MNINTNKKYRIWFYSIFIFTLLVFASPASGHGGKTHKDNSFTALQALQKASAMFDKLIVSNKLPESWETGLLKVEILIRKKNGKSEYVVAFHRAEGEPAAVYFFFTMEGKYSGSNFTGK